MVMSKVYAFSVPDGYDLEATVKRARGASTLSRSALILRALEEYGGGDGNRLDAYMADAPVSHLLEERPHDELVAAVRDLITSSPNRAAQVREQARTLAAVIDYVGGERGGLPGVS